MLGKAMWRLRIQETLHQPGLHPGPHWGSLQRFRNCWWDGLSVPPQERHPHSWPFRPRLSYPHSKISSDAVVSHAPPSLRGRVPQRAKKFLGPSTCMRTHGMRISNQISHGDQTILTERFYTVYQKTTMLPALAKHLCDMNADARSVCGS